MLKRWKTEFLCLLEQGCVPCYWDTLLATQSGTWLGQWTSWSQSDQRLLTSPNQLSSHWCHSPQNSGQQLQAIAQLPKSPDRERARYLLASDLIQQQAKRHLKQWIV